MKKIGVLTFHSSYNYGSNLQAYALQEFIKKISTEKINYKIINLRTKIQEEQYKYFFDKTGLNNNIKKIVLYKEKKNLRIKKELFENFINNKLNVTEKYSTYEDVKNANKKYDYLIAGSDQLWNLEATDFDWTYFLDFTNNAKKISYSASFGPKKIKWNEAQKQRMKKALNSFSNISVREEGSKNNIYKLIKKNSEIHVDPTLLLEKKDWLNLLEESKIIKPKRYIFLYNLKGKEYANLAKKISKELNLPIVVSLYGGFYEIIYGFKRCYATGPIEFLDLINNADLVLSSSFHGTIFSIIFNKPFFSLNGDKDLRISNLLKILNLDNRTINIENYKERCKNAFKIDFDKAEESIKKERERSSHYLKKSLEIDEDNYGKNM